MPGRCRAAHAREAPAVQSALSVSLAALPGGLSHLMKASGNCVIRRASRGGGRGLADSQAY